MSMTISIYKCSAVLYNGTAPIAAHAGSSESIRTWIEQTRDEHYLKDCKIYGWHNLIALAEKERGE
jgi:hypothetical protein